MSGSPPPSAPTPAANSAPLAPAPAAPGAAREVELKLLLTPGDLARVPGLPVVRDHLLEPPVTHTVRTIYHDTPDLRLAAKGIALRLRFDGEGWSLAAKTAGADRSSDRAALAVRREWECPLDGGVTEGGGLDWDALDRLGAGALVAADLRPHLRPLFETVVERTRLNLSLPGGALVELALDRGTVRAGEATAPLCEMELELREGPVLGLFDLALALHDKVPFRIGAENKAELGMRLLTGRPASAARPTPVALSRLVTVAEAFRHIARHTLRRLLGNVTCVIAHGDGEGVRHLRGAARRLRIVMRLMRGMVGEGEARDVVKESRWLSRGLADARRWDITLEALERLGRDARDPVVRAARMAREDAVRAAARRLSNRRFTRFVLTLARWVEDDRWRIVASAQARAALERPVAELAAQWIDPAAARARKAARKLASATDLSDAAEAARRRARRLRVVTELCRGLYPPSVVDPFLGDLAAVAGPLGCAHDVMTARRVLRRLAEERPDLAADIRPIDRELAAGVEPPIRAACRAVGEWAVPGLASAAGFWRDS